MNSVELENDKFNSELSTLLKTKLFPAGKTSADPTMVFYPDHEGWLTKTDQILTEKYPLAINRQLFNFNKEKFMKLKASTDKKFILKKIDNAILKNIGKKILEDIKISWISEERFLERGVGFVLLQDDKLISSCHSCFANGEAYEISVNTYQDRFRKKGYATAVTVKFIDYCLENEIEPKWECWEGNTSSERLAEKLGFEKKSLYPVQFVLLNEIDEYMENAFYYRFKLKKYQESAEFFEKAFDLMDEIDPKNLYACSCSFALAGNRDKAFDYLHRAIEMGFDPKQVENKALLDLMQNNNDPI